MNTWVLILIIWYNGNGVAAVRVAEYDSKDRCAIAAGVATFSAFARQSQPICIPGR